MALIAYKLFMDKMRRKNNLRIENSRPKLHLLDSKDTFLHLVILHCKTLGSHVVQ